MPKYEMIFTSSRETAKALNAIMIDQVDDLSFRMISQEKAVYKNSGFHHRVSGTTTLKEVFEMCQSGRAVTRDMIVTHFRDMGWKETTVGATISRLCLTKLFEKVGDSSIRLISTKTTWDEVNKVAAKINSSYRGRK